MIEVIIGSIGIYALTSYAQSIRIGFSGPLSSYLSILQIPAVISLVYGLSISTGWWCILVFICASLAAGLSNGVLLKKIGPNGLVDRQLIRAFIFTIAAIAIWMPWFLK